MLVQIPCDQFEVPDLQANYYLRDTVGANLKILGLELDPRNSAEKQTETG
jgi:hypothetical protein